MKINEVLLQEILDWLKKKFNQKRSVRELYLIGSSLDKFVVNDIDIVQYVTFESRQSLREYAKDLKAIKIDFFSTFKIPLHVTSFTDNESHNFTIFVSLNHSKKII